MLNRQLEIAYRNELNFADLLPYEHHLIDDAHEKLGELQQKMAQLQNGSNEDSATNGASPLVVGLMKSSVARVNWLVAAYLTIRRQKIEAHYAHIASHASKYADLMSACEKEFFQAYARLTDAFLYASTQLERAMPTPPDKVHQRLFEFATTPSAEHCAFLHCDATGETSLCARITPETAADIANKRVYLL